MADDREYTRAEMRKACADNYAAGLAAGTAARLAAIEAKLDLVIRLLRHDLRPEDYRFQATGGQSLWDQQMQNQLQAQADRPKQGGDGG